MARRFLMVSAVTAATLLFGLAVVAVTPATALEKSESVCASSKLKATGQKVLSKLKCEAKAIKKATDVDPDCLTKAEDKFSSAFTKAEGKAAPDGGCISQEDAVTVEGDVDALVNGMVLFQKTGSGLLPACDELMGPCGNCTNGVCVNYGAFLGCVDMSSGGDGIGCTRDSQCTAGEYCISIPDAGSMCAPPCGQVEPLGPLDKAESACASSKLKATGKKVLSKLKCEAKAIQKDTTVDSDCLTKAEDKFSSAFAKAEFKGGCVSKDDTVQVEGAVDTFVDSTVALQLTPVIVVPLPSCTELLSQCGSCETGGTCLDHDPDPGCATIGAGIYFTCTSDADCPTGEYCMDISFLSPPPGFPFPTLPDWGCLAPCP